jgi:hypothetical protein
VIGFLQFEIGLFARQRNDITIQGKHVERDSIWAVGEIPRHGDGDSRRDGRSRRIGNLGSAIEHHRTLAQTAPDVVPQVGSSAAFERTAGPERRGFVQSPELLSSCLCRAALRTNNGRANASLQPARRAVARACRQRSVKPCAVKRCVDNPPDHCFLYWIQRSGSRSSFDR